MKGKERERERERERETGMNKWRDRQAKNQEVRERQAEVEKDGGKEKLRERQINKRKREKNILTDEQMERQTGWRTERKAGRKTRSWIWIWPVLVTERETDSILKLQLSSVNNRRFFPFALLGVVNRSCYLDLSGRRGYSTIVNSPFECTCTHTHTHTHTVIRALCVCVCEGWWAYFPL